MKLESFHTRFAGVLLFPAILANVGVADTICGPRCAMRILQTFNRAGDVTLAALVEEIQNSDFTADSSLADIEVALNRRGLYTRAVRVQNATAVTVNTPAIAWIDHSDKGQMGHFVVLESASNERVVFWDGPGKLYEVTQSQWLKLWSGVALLAGEEPLSDESLTVHGSLRQYAFRWIPLAIVLLFFTVKNVQILKNRRAH